MIRILNSSLFLLRCASSQLSNIAPVSGCLHPSSLRRNFHDDAEKAPPRNSTKDYILENPELQKLLTDLYDKYDEPKKNQRNKIQASIATRFDEYKDEDAQVIYDIDEERAMQEELEDLEAEAVTKENAQNVFQGIDLSHGLRGVFEIEDLLHLLRRENCSDICVITVPSELAYVDYMVVTTCKSSRHVIAVTEFIMKVIKRKTKKPHEIPVVEGGKKTEEWVAMDMGNIALHIFTKTTRERYDIESLWTLGPEMDELSQQRDYLEGLTMQNDLLKDLKPLP